MPTIDASLLVENALPIVVTGLALLLFGISIAMCWQAARNYEPLPIVAIVIAGIAVLIVVAVLLQMYFIFGVAGVLYLLLRAGKALE